MKVAFIDLIPAFELATKHKVTAVYGAPGFSFRNALRQSSFDMRPGQFLFQSCSG